MGFSPLANMARRIPDMGRKSPRYASVTGVVVHYNAGINSYGEATNPSREVSANYWITNDGQILPNVDEEYRAWTSGAKGYPNGALADCHSITVEVSNEPGWQSSSPMGKISDAAYRALANLIGDVFRRRSLGTVRRTTSPTAVGVREHNDFVPTSCPGPWLEARMPDLIKQAEKARTGGTPTAPPSTPTTSGKLSTAQVAKQVIDGDWGNGSDRQSRLTAAGYNYSVVQAEVNRQLGIGPASSSASSTPAPTAGANISALADAVQRGDYGNGDQRKAALGSNYGLVQAEVNRRLGIRTQKPTTPGLSIAQMAQKAINGDYGNGEARRVALGANYAAVQAEVNRRLYGGTAGANPGNTALSIDALAQAVLNGDYGNGDERRRRLGNNYAAVQARVNQLLGVTPVPVATSASIEDLARAVIRGDYGNGQERKNRLGTNYQAVQNRVNQILGY